MSKKAHPVIRALTGKLTATGTPLCCRCAMKRGIDTVNVKDPWLPCSKCKETTNWRKAV